MAIRVIGWLGFLPFCVSPQLWWHGTTGSITTTAGSRASIRTCIRRSPNTRADPASRIMADTSARRRRLAGVASLLFGFTGQSVQILLRARTSGMLAPHLHRRAIIETVTGAAVWIASPSFVRSRSCSSTCCR